MIKENLLGKTFGRWTVVEPAESYKTKKGTSRGARWVCECSCGNRSTVSSRALKKGSSQSCGCLRSEKIKTRLRKDLGESAFSYVYRIYKHSAKRRGYSFNISENSFKELSSKPCAYCGIAPATKMASSKGRTFYGEFVYNGLDRVDNTKGYEIDNVVPCCYFCNTLKGKKSKEDFLSKIKQIYENLELNRV